MALKVTTTLRNMRHVSHLDGFVGDDYDYLVQAEEYGHTITVNCLATDGYYDVTLTRYPTDREVAALSWYHLDGFDENGPVIG
jgi:hypothetical protein